MRRFQNFSEHKIFIFHLQFPFFTYAIQKPINFIAASDQEVDWWFMWAPIIYGWIPVDRERVAPSTIKLAIQAL